MAFDAGTVRVTGLREFTSALRQIDKELPKMVTGVNLALAEHVVDKARPMLVTKGGKQARSAPSLRASGTQRGASVRASGPTVQGDEYGALAFPQFRPWRGSAADAGYAIWPAIREERKAIDAGYIEGLLQALIDRSLP
jgi:hypothetical protein